MASSSFVNKNNSEYDVFLSFRGETRYNFTSHLYNALQAANIKVFIDKSLEEGEELTPALLKVIDGAKISVVILSSEYASSTFCLEELAKIIECKESKGQTVLPVFYKVDPSNIRKLKRTFEEAFQVRESNFKEEMEKVERWKSALRKASHLKGWPVEDKSDEVEIIQAISQKISKILDCKPTGKSKGQELISTPLVGVTAKSNIEKIWLCLMDENISRVGIYGMGGVGKTTIAIHINNQLKKSTSFQHVYWVTVSKESGTYKLQSDIAKEIDLDLSREEDERKRATKLQEALISKKRFVLILDDMWESFELEEEVGVPILAEGGKLLFTTRQHGLCQRMKCDRIVKVEPLIEQEALDLFVKESGHQIDDNPELRNNVKLIVEECDGLPLAVKVIARSTRGFASHYKWRNILQELRKPSERQNLDMEQVFKLLKVSYDCLSNDKYRQCLQYCAMYPEDFHLERDELIEYCIADGVIDEQDSRQEEFDMGNTIIDELIDASLLENAFGSRAKMHDVVRDMILAITRGSLLVKAGLQLQDFPKFSDWCDNLEGMSIMENYKMEGCSFNSAPNCYKLGILLMQYNEKLSELPNCFFVDMQNLTILDMSNLESLKLLPDSISKLETLRMLNLERCYSLEFVPCLAASKDLRYLILSWTKLQNLPEGMEKLVNMKVLRFSYVETLCALNPSEILIELSLLQELDLFGSNVEVGPNALSNLKKLEKLRVEFKNFEALNSYLESGNWQRLESYFIAIKGYVYEFGDEPEDDDVFPYDKALFWYKDMDWCFAPRNMGNSNFVIPFNVEYCKLRDWDSPLDGVVINGDFAHLKELILWQCELKYLVSVDFAKQLLQNICFLRVADCEDIEKIIKTEEPFDQNSLKNFPTIELPNLRALHLEDLPRLRSIYGGNVDLPSLENLMIDECDNLVRLPFRKQPVSMCGSNICFKLWWDSLRWDDQNHKQVFEKFILEKTW